MSDRREEALRTLKTLPARVKRLFDPPIGPDARPLEIRAALLDDLEDRIVAIGGGRRVLPYGGITVRIVATGAARTTLEAVFKDHAAQIERRLVQLRCEAPRDLRVRFEYLKKPRTEWRQGQIFDVEYQAERSDPPPPLEKSAPTLHVRVIRGAASNDHFAFAGPLVRIGRTAEARDRAGNVRRNDLVFHDDRDPVNQTVGRAHAHFQYDAARAEYRLFDDGSRNGTVIVRSTETIRVPPRDPRGVGVRSGDEIRIGDAALAVDIQNG